MKLFTVGVAQISAEAFFSLLWHHGVERVIDVRLRADGQLAGFAKKRDLPYFLDHLSNCRYSHLPILAPTPAILDSYRKDHDWKHYVEQFEALMDERDVPNTIERFLFESETCCLLCSENSPAHCHRRLVAERLASTWNGLDVIHLG